MLYPRAAGMTSAAYIQYLSANYCTIAARAVFIWDFCITMGDEVQYFWGHKVTAVSVLFLLNRYVNLAITIMQLFVQSSFQTIHLQPICPHSASIRLTGVYHSCCLYGAESVCNLASQLDACPPRILIGDDSSDSNPHGVGTIPFCRLRTPIDVAHGTLQQECSTVLIAMRAATVAYDSLVLILTLLRTLSLRRRGSTKSGLVSLILRDGCLYFTCLVLLNVTQIIITSYYTGNNYLSYFVSPLTSILISRFLLNLRHFSDVETSARDAYTSLYLTSHNPSGHSNSDIFLSGLNGLMTEPSIFSDTFQSDGTHAAKDIELKSYRQQEDLDATSLT
ncbi:hypothetical protein BC835DRAFT_1412217 [Cytidiella melzeri]|nr:hypothetical protein BC835DRAFT_1412217 [Cytidiella melzeri]